MCYQRRVVLNQGMSLNTPPTFFKVEHSTGSEHFLSDFLQDLLKFIPTNLGLMMLSDSRCDASGLFTLL